MQIGIFDSGRGGELVAARLRQLLPAHFTYRVVSDPEHAPYGERRYEEIERLTHARVHQLVPDCPLIIIACNTATAAAIDSLRAKYPETIFIGYEPMIKSASKQSPARHITLLATQATAQSHRTRGLITKYAPDFIIDIPKTVGWSQMIDQDRTDAIDLSEVITSAMTGSDVIIIACTHYIALEGRLKDLGATILEPTESVAKRVLEVTAT